MPKSTKPNGTPADRRFFADPKRRQELLKLLAIGASRADAAMKLGITRRTIWNECERDQAFKRAVEQAEAAGKIELIAALRKAATSNDWRATLAMLQAKYSEWSRNAHDAMPIKALVRMLTKLREAICKAVPVEHHAAVGAAIDVQLQMLVGDDEDRDEGGDSDGD